MKHGDRRTKTNYFCFFFPPSGKIISHILIKVNTPITTHKPITKHLSSISFSNGLHGYGCVKWRSTILFELERQLSNKKEVGKE